MQRIELSTLLLSASISFCGQRLVLRFKVAMEIKAALKISEASGQRAMERVSNQRDAAVREGAGPGV